jgi:hypothetical protein
LDPFSKLLDDLGPAAASDVCWAIYFTEDPSSTFYRYDIEERRRRIERDFLRVEKFPWEEYEDIIKAYPGLAMRKDKRLYKIWADKLEGLTSYFSGLDFNNKVEQREIMGIYQNAASYWKTFKEIEKDFIEDESSEEMRGGAKAGGMYNKK